MAHKGKFKPKNPKKYKGDPTNIVYRSSWEACVMMQLDQNPDVLQWCSEEIAILYKSPWDEKPHRYFPDLLVWKRMKDNTVQISMIEIKPHAQSIPPTVPKNLNSKRYLREVQTWGVNSAKWAAARRYCAKKGWVFQVLTEKELGLF